MRYAPTLLGRRNGSFRRNNNPNRKKMKVLPRERLNTKSGSLTLQDARLPCNKRMAYTMVGEDLDAEPMIRLSDRKEARC